MTIRPALSGAVLGMLVLTGCAVAGGGAAPTSTGPYPYAADDLVLQVAWTGGFVAPQMLAGRLPLVSVYGDGRVISEGPVPAVFPGPALPDLQVARIDRAAVQGLVDRALDAGVSDTGDLGTPPLADAPSTRFTVSTGLETIVREAYALTEAADDGTGLTAEQAAARAELRGFLDELTGLSGGASESYAPGAVAALATPYAAEPDLPQPDAAWPGPALPGEPIEGPPGVSCVVATGEQAAAVLDAAAQANALTPWVTAEGARWSVLFRPLLPHETGCADLQS